MCRCERWSSDKNEQSSKPHLMEIGTASFPWRWSISKHRVVIVFAHPHETQNGNHEYYKRREVHCHCPPANDPSMLQNNRDGNASYSRSSGQEFCRIDPAVSMIMTCGEKGKRTWILCKSLFWIILQYLKSTVFKFQLIEKYLSNGLQRQKSNLSLESVYSEELSDPAKNNKGMGRSTYIITAKNDAVKLVKKNTSSDLDYGIMKKNVWYTYT